MENFFTKCQNRNHFTKLKGLHHTANITLNQVNFELIHTDKVLYEEMMTNDDNLESNLLTSSLLKIHSLYKFCYKLHMLSQRSR